MLAHDSRKGEAMEVEAMEVWGKDEGYCAWCVDTLLIGYPIWEYGVDSQGDSVKYACCTPCAEDRGVEKEGING